MKKNQFALNGMLDEIANNLRKQTAILPVPKFMNHPDPGRILLDVSERINRVFEEYFGLHSNVIEEFSIDKLTMQHSKIMKKYDDVLTLKKWINSSRPIFLKLVYRGSRDGFAAASFHKMCDNHWPTLTVIQSNHGNVFGGFTDQSWVSINHFKKSDKSFIFSLTHRKKCEIKPEKSASAIYTNDGYLVAFGEGLDLSLVDRCNEMECHSLMGFTYEDPYQGKGIG